MPLRSRNCVRCGKPFTLKPKGRSERCPPCRVLNGRERSNERTRQWRVDNPDRRREIENRHNRKRLADPAHRQRKRDDHNLRVYGLTPEQIQEMRERQGDLCAICRGAHVGHGTRLHIDHDHETGRVRALLCSRCNTMLGLAGEDPARLEAAAAYLRSFTPVEA